MGKRRIQSQHLRPSCARSPFWVSPIAALILCSMLAASLLQACTLAPVVLVGSTTAAGLAMEAEKAVNDSDRSVLVAVEQDAVVYEGPGEEYSEIARLNKGVEVKVLKKDGDWIQCKSGQFEEGWIHVSAVKDI